MIRKIGGFFDRWSSASLVANGLRQAGVPHASKIPSYTTSSELHVLYRLARRCQPGAIALEIGSHLGASTCYLGAGLKEQSGVLFAVDTWHNETMPEGEQDTYSQFLQNTSGLGPTLIPVRKRSEHLSSQDVRTPISLLFIDGDHSYEAVKRDFEVTSPWLTDSATIAFHDTTAFQGVSRFLGELLASGQYQLEGHVGNLSWIRKARLRS